MPVDQRKQRNAGEPGDGCFPPEPVEYRRHEFRDVLLLDDIEATAVNHPYAIVRCLLAILLHYFSEPTVQPCKEVRLADPQNAGEDVDPVQNHVQPLGKVEVHEEDLSVVVTDELCVRI